MRRESLLELAACLGGRANDEGVCCFDLFLQLLRSQVIGSVHIAHLLQQLNAWMHHISCQFMHAWIYAMNFAAAACVEKPASHC